MYDRILLPTDGSETISVVTEHALELASVHHATLHALYVANTASLSDIPADAGWEGVTEALHREGERALESIEEHADDVPVETELREGSPHKEILGYAADSDVDVVVMGTHGRSGVDRLLLGSVAEKVVRSSQTPVLTIRVDED